MISFKVENLKNMNASLKEFAEFLRRNDVAEEDVFASRLVSCELISNVIIHGGEAADFTGELSGGKICITVSASGFENVNLQPPLPDILAESGRGLYIVRSICFGEIERSDGGLKVYIKLH